MLQNLATGVQVSQNTGVPGETVRVRVRGATSVSYTHLDVYKRQDGICIKSGKDEQGRKRGEPCQNVIVMNNTVLHGHGGFVVGSETVSYTHLHYPM